MVLVHEVSNHYYLSGLLSLQNHIYVCMYVGPCLQLFELFREVVACLYCRWTMVFFSIFDSKLRAEKKAEEDRKVRLEFERLRQVLGVNTAFPGGLHDEEIWWRDHSVWLKEFGYQLPSRYAPDWVPSWQGTDKYWALCEDSWHMPVSFSCWIKICTLTKARPHK
jgi:hypothetical protein